MTEHLNDYLHFLDTFVKCCAALPSWITGTFYYQTYVIDPRPPVRTIHMATQGVHELILLTYVKFPGVAPCRKCALGLFTQRGSSLCKTCWRDYPGVCVCVINKTIPVTDQ